MDILAVIGSKPVLIGLHLGFAIIGIDAFIWLFGELVADSRHVLRMKVASVLGVFGFVMSWIIGGYYYVVFYGPFVKPVIKEGLAPWAHFIAMEAKEHIFLFLIPLALTAAFITFVTKREDWALLRRPLKILSALIALLGLGIGVMGYIISAAARWGAQI